MNPTIDEPAAPPAATSAASDSELALAAAAASAAALEVVAGPLLSTPLDAMSAPLVVVDQPGWKLTGAFGQVGPTLSGGFEGSTVLVGDGPRYDAPLFVTTVVETAEPSTTTQVTTPSASSLLEMGEPIEVAGTTGSVVVAQTDEDSGLDGPVVVMFSCAIGAPPPAMAKPSAPASENTSVATAAGTQTATCTRCS